MSVVTPKRSRSGRSGSLGSSRRVLWEAIASCRQVLRETEDDAMILQTTRVLTRASLAYARLLKGEQHAP